MDAGKEEMEQSSPFIVKYRQQYYDLSKFMHKHPGGITNLKGLNDADMTARFLKAPPHSDAAMYLMREYKVDPTELEGNKNKKTKERPSKTTTTTNGIELLQHAKEAEDSNNNHMDESMEVRIINIASYLLAVFVD
ncbi:hypothetical protein ACLKA7_012611 [Drosophila subpalustris]